MRVEMRLFGHVAHALLVGDQVALDGFAVEQDLARGGLQQPGDHLHRGGFAGAVRPQVPGDLAGARRKADIVHGRDAAESLGNVAKFQHCTLCSKLLIRLSSSMLHRYNSRVALEPKLSHTAALILQAIHAGHVYGFSVMEMTGLPSGTVYPAMRRLERDSLIRSQWERRRSPTPPCGRPRKYYKLTRSGKATLEASHKRYPLLAKLIPSPEAENA